MNISLIIQARMNSSRLPGKVMMPIMGRPILEYCLERVAKSKKISEIIVATSNLKVDEEIVNFVSNLGFKYFCGSETDVLNRYFLAAKKYNSDVIVRCNADCPLIDSDIIDLIINAYLDNIGKYDYVSNILEPSFPIGMHTEVFSYDSLESANTNAKNILEREHVTPYIYNNPQKFNLKNISMKEDLSHYRLTLDQIEDYELIKKIYENLYDTNKNFSMIDIINLIKEKESWLQLNRHIEKNSIISNI